MNETNKLPGLNFPAHPKQNRHIPIHANFNAAEHISASADCTLRFAEGEEQPLKSVALVLSTQSDFKLSYGQIISLAGDFYGDPKSPVTGMEGDNLFEQQITQFQANVEKLRRSKQQALDILECVRQYESLRLDKKIGDGDIPSSVYGSEDFTPSGVESTKFEQIVPDYFELALYNFDHFGTDAKKCYMAGHTLAQRVAAGLAMTDLSSNNERLNLAYVINAFADHFLTDLFAAGHLRVPRRKLYQLANFAGSAGILSKAMHDEDNKFGLWVTNRNEDRWVSYGDARYFDVCNSANRWVIKAALQASVDEVWDSWVKKAVSQSGEASRVLSFLPTLIDDACDDSGRGIEKMIDDESNWAPLFVFCGGQIMIREYDKDVSCRSYVYWSDKQFSTDLNALKNAFGQYVPLMPSLEYDGYDRRDPLAKLLGWPAGPSGIKGESRVRGVTGPTFRGMTDRDWKLGTCIA